MLDIRKTKLPKRDGRGRMRILKGKRQDGSNAGFQIADSETSDAEAQRRFNVIHTLCEKQCQQSQCDHWHEWTYRTALVIGKGYKITDTFLSTTLSTPSMSATIVRLRDWGIPVHIGDDVQYRHGLQVNKEQIETMVADLVSQKMSEI